MSYFKNVTGTSPLVTSLST